MRLHRGQSTSLVIGLAACVAMSVACESRVTGKDGNLEFSYVTTDSVWDFNKPVAVGARLDLKVAEAGTRGSATVQAAQSESPDVLRIESFSGNTIVLEGEADGRSEIRVEARISSGDVVSDGVDMRAAVPDVLKMNHNCTTDTEGLYIVGQKVWIPFDMELANGESVIGYGYHPIDVDPAGGVQIDRTTKDQAHFRLTTSNDELTVTLSSQLDSTTLTMRLIQEGAIDGIARIHESAAVFVGGSSYVVVRPTVGGKQVCQADSPVTVTTSTPEICSVSTTNQQEDVQGVFNERGWLSVTGLSPGTCDFTVTYTNGNNGAGVSVDLSAEIEAQRAPGP